MAASCERIGAQSIEYWWTFIIASISSEGPHAYPILNPVIAKAFEKPCRKIVCAP